MRCPKCGDEDKLDIQESLWVRPCDDGADEDASGTGGAHEHPPMSAAICGAGNHRGAIWEFRTAVTSNPTFIEDDGRRFAWRDLVRQWRE